jgi:hypothetical protein
MDRSFDLGRESWSFKRRSMKENPGKRRLPGDLDWLEIVMEPNRYTQEASG